MKKESEIDMDKDLEKIYKEILIMNETAQKFRAQASDSIYTTNLLEKARKCNDLMGRIYSIIGFQPADMDELKNKLVASSFKSLTDDQKRELTEIRSLPMYKKVMGESALQMKEELEQVLEIKLSSDGIPILTEKGAIMSVKDEDTLWSELDMHTEKLSDLVSNGKITEEQAERYEEALDAIYTFYVSQSKGEQIELRQITDSEIQRMEEQAEYDRVSMAYLYQELNRDLKSDFDDIQEAAKLAQKSSRSL